MKGRLLKILSTAIIISSLSLPCFAGERHEGSPQVVKVGIMNIRDDFHYALDNSRAYYINFDFIKSHLYKAFGKDYRSEDYLIEYTDQMCIDFPHPDVFSTIVYFERPYYPKKIQQDFKDPSKKVKILRQLEKKLAKTKDFNFKRLETAKKSIPEGEVTIDTWDNGIYTVSLENTKLKNGKELLTMAIIYKDKATRE